MPDPYLADAAFRAAVRANPLAAAAAEGFILTGAERGALMKANATWNAKNLSDADRVAITEGMLAVQPLALFW